MQAFQCCNIFKVVFFWYWPDDGLLCSNQQPVLINNKYYIVVQDGLPLSLFYLPTINTAGRPQPRSRIFAERNQYFVLRQQVIWDFQIGELNQVKLVSILISIVVLVCTYNLVYFYVFSGLFVTNFSFSSFAFCFVSFLFSLD